MRITLDRVLCHLRMTSAQAVFTASLLACGGSTPSSSTPSADDGPGRGGETDDAGAGGEAATAKEEKPFAGSTSEATEMISAVVDKRHSEIGACVRGFRARKKVASGKVAVSFGIDQEGRLLGVTSKGKEDAELKGCIMEALKGAPFPRSHAGVITVTKTYEDLVVE